MIKAGSDHQQKTKQVGKGCGGVRQSYSLKWITQITQLQRTQTIMEWAGENSLKWSSPVIQEPEIPLPPNGMQWDIHHVLYAIFLPQTFNLNLILGEQRDKSWLCDIL